MFVLDITQPGKKKVEYHIKNDWPDLTIQDAIDLFKVIKKAPALLSKIYHAKTQEKLDELHAKVTHEHEVKTFPLFYGKMLMAMSDIPKEIMRQMQANERSSLYKILCEETVIGLIHLPTKYEPQEEGGFEWKGEKLLYPASRIKMGEKIPLSEATALEFTEIADLEIFAKEMEGGKYEKAANIISILCRPEGEEYDEEISLKRAETMKDIPLNVMWDVFFWLIKHINASTRASAISISRRERRKLKRLRERASTASAGTAASSDQPQQ